MKKFVFLTLIIVYASWLRLFKLGVIPPQIPNKTNIFYRAESAILGIGSILLLYLYAERISGKVKIALLSSYLLSTLSWHIEQSRIYSQPNFTTFLILTTILLVYSTYKTYWQALIIISVIVVISFIYQQMWLISSNILRFSGKSFVENLFILLSPSFLFFRNITFWWGGVREAGVFYISLFPFLIVGLVQLITNKQFQLLIFVSIITIFAAASPYFPESREFYFSIPFFTIIIAIGFYRLYTNLNFKIRLFFWIICIFMLYEIGQFLHFYSIHFPQQFYEAKQHINESY